jgi:hypothetical protein
MQGAIVVGSVEASHIGIDSSSNKGLISGITIFACT